MFACHLEVPTLPAFISIFGTAVHFIWNVKLLNGFLQYWEVLHFGCNRNRVAAKTLSTPA